MEEKKSLDNIVAENLAYYRKASGLTQLELAERLNYSDKSISKWERAEGMPDIFILKALADFYGIRVDDFYREEKRHLPMSKTSRHWFIVGLTELLVWLVFGIAYVVFKLALPNAFHWWLIFIYAATASFILALVWACIYKKKFYQLISTSCLIWFGLTSVFLTVLMVSPINNLWLMFLVGIPLQGLAILWYFLKKNKEKERAGTK